MYRFEVALTSILAVGKFWQRYMGWLHKGSLAVIDQVFFSLSNFAVNILLARWLSGESYGSFAIASSLFLLVSGLLNALLLEPMSVVSPQRDEQALQRRLQILFWIYVGISGLSVIVFAAILLGYGIFTRVDTEILVAISGMIVSLPGVYLYWFSRRMTYTAHRPGVAALTSAMYSLVSLFGLWLLYRFEMLSIWNIQMMFGGLGAITGIGMFLYLVRGILIVDFSTVEGIAHSHWEYGRWVLISSVLYWLSNSMYTPLIGMYAGLRSAAGFRSIQNVTLPMTQIITALSLLVMPMAALRWQTQGTQALRKFSRSICLTFISFNVLYIASVLLVKDSLLVWLYGEQSGELYGDFSGLLLPLLIGVLIDTWRQCHAIPLSAIRRSDAALWARVASTISMFVVGVPLLARFGIVGAAWGLAIHNGISGVVFWQLGKKWMR